MRTKLRFLFSLALAGWVFPAAAQWTTQTLSLQPGWNAVYLEIQPEPRQCQQALAGVPVESVWGWNRKFSSVQFIQDPTDLVTANPDWLSWVPGAATNLFTFEGGRAYLIKLPGSSPRTWLIRGRPLVRRVDWISDSFNLVGFPVDAQNTPTFQMFFAGSAAHLGQPIYRLTAAGHWDRVTDPATTSMRRGEAFWIRCTGSSTYAGPFKVELEQGTALEYGRTLTEQRLRIKNESGSPRSLTVQPLPSGTPPTPAYPALAGPVPLAYFRMNLANQEYGWVPLPALLTNLSLAAGEEMELRLEARRAEMNPYPPGTNSAGALYQTLLQITDIAGARQLVGVTSAGLDSVLNAHKRSGLWVGNAVLRSVRQTGATNLSPTATEFQFRLIVHVDRQGQPKLLQQVLQRWRQGPEGQPGRYVLLTDASSVTAADTAQGARRISSAAFGFQSPIALSGSGEFGAGTFNGLVTMPYNDPLNPYKHAYHPDHDNLNANFDPSPLVEEAFAVDRQIRLQFTADDPEGLTLPGWGDSQLGGVYRETIAGLTPAHLPLLAEGTFRLHRVSRLAELNPIN